MDFDHGGRFVLYYEFLSEDDSGGFTSTDRNELPTRIDATVTAANGTPLIVHDKRNDFSFLFSGNAGISFASVRIPGPGTYTVHVTSSETTPFVVSVGPSMLGRIARTVLLGLGLLGIGVIAGVILLIVIAVKPRPSEAGAATARGGGQLAAAGLRLRLRVRPAVGSAPAAVHLAARTGAASASAAEQWLGQPARLHHPPARRRHPHCRRPPVRSRAGSGCSPVRTEPTSPAPATQQWRLPRRPAGTPRGAARRGSHPWQSRMT